MARYCTQCGQSLPDPASFCIHCGARQGAAAEAPPSQYAAPPPIAPQPVPAAAKSSGLGKVLLILGCVFLLIVGTGIAGVAYVAYKAKNAVQQAAKREGIDLGELMEGRKGSLRGAPCSFLSAREAGQLLGVAITRAEDEGRKCNYYAERSAEDRSKSVEDAYAKLKDAKGADGAKEFERLTKEIVGGANDGSGAYLTVEYNEDGKAAMTGFKLAMRSMGQNERLEGVGEEALVGPMASIMMFIKNGVAVQLDLRQVAEGREKGAEIARRIASRL